MAGASRQPVFEFTNRWADLSKLFPEPLSEELINLLEQRDRDLEDALNKQPVIYDHDAGAPERSKPWTAKEFTRIRRWSSEIAQDDAGDDIVLGADWTLELHYDGVMVAELTLPAGQAYVEYSGAPLPIVPRGTRITMYTNDTTFDFVSTIWL